MTLAEFLNTAEARFNRASLHYGHGTDNARDEAVYLAFETLGISYDSSPDILERRLSAAELQELESLVNRRIAEHKPVAYLVGNAWFAGESYLSDERALVPRSPVAELIENGFAGLLNTAPARILDLCCGGGCIGIASALKFPDATVDLLDISTEALALARDNIALHGVGHRVSVRHSDLFSNTDGPYDLIISNPPYVSEAEFNALPAEYHAEPSLGLLSAAQGLEIPLGILQTAAAELREGGLLVMEVGSSAELLQRHLAAVPLLWLEFAYGGDGVFAITRQELKRHAQEFI